MAYEKPWLSFNDQLQNLKSRGMVITDESKALEHLERIGYYRLLASWRRCLSYLRNVCAHHSRLWNRNMSEQPKKPDAGEAPLLAVQSHTGAVFCAPVHYSPLTH
jgi:abortive infection bacteriophage resistance protein